MLLQLGIVLFLTQDNTDVYEESRETVTHKALFVVNFTLGSLYNRTTDQ